MLQEPEEALDFVPLFIQLFVILPLYDAIGFWRNYRHDAFRLKRGHDDISVIPFIGQGRTGLKTFQQRKGLCAVVALTGRHDKAQRVAQRIAHGMNLGREATPRAP